MARIVNFCLYTVQDNIHIHETALRRRAIADLFYCKTWKGHPMHLERLNEDEYVAYIGGYEGETVNLREAAQALGMEISDKRKVLQDDEWVPLFAEGFHKECCCVQFFDFVGSPIVIPDVVKEVPCHPLRTMFTGEETEVMVESTKTLLYTGEESSEEIFKALEEKYGIGRYMYKERNGIRFYIKIVDLTHYALWVLGPALIMPEHSRFWELMDKLNIKFTESIRKEMEERSNGED